MTDTYPAQPNTPQPDETSAGENICPRCSGRGRLADGSQCPECEGTGKITEGIGGA